MGHFPVMQQREHGEVILSVSMGSSPCGNSPWLKKYQYLSLNRLQVSLKEEIIVNLETE